MSITMIRNLKNYVIYDVQMPAIVEKVSDLGCIYKLDCEFD